VVSAVERIAYDVLLIQMTPEPVAANTSTKEGLTLSLLGRRDGLPQNYALSYVQRVDPDAAKPLQDQLEKSPWGKFPMRPNLP
jgi:hypothetical protein